MKKSFIFCFIFFPLLVGCANNIQGLQREPARKIGNNLAGNQVESKNDEEVSDNSKKIAKMMNEISVLAAKFSDSLEGKKIGDIVHNAGEIANLTVGQYLEYGVKTSQGTVFYMEDHKPVKQETANAKVFATGRTDDSRVKKFLLNEYQEFYQSIAELMMDLAKQAKNLPIRLNDITIELAPFGLGGSVSIGVNYDSPMFDEKQ